MAGKRHMQPPHPPRSAQEQQLTYPFVTVGTVQGAQDSFRSSWDVFILISFTIRKKKDKYENKEYMIMKSARMTQFAKYNLEFCYGGKDL